MVLEFLENDLERISRSLPSSNNRTRGVFKLGDVKAYMLQLLNGLSAMHDKGILHRDLKLANLLVSKHGVLKLADFGLSRQSVRANEQAGELTPNVCTVWYRAPELFLTGCAFSRASALVERRNRACSCIKVQCCKQWHVSQGLLRDCTRLPCVVHCYTLQHLLMHTTCRYAFRTCRKERLVYGAEIDVWSAGCIFAELLQGQPLFGKHEEVQVWDAICEELGSPVPEEWPEVVHLSGWESCVKNNRAYKMPDTLRKNTLRVRQVSSLAARCLSCSAQTCCDLDLRSADHTGCASMVSVGVLTDLAYAYNCIGLAVLVPTC